MLAMNLSEEGREVKKDNERSRDVERGGAWVNSFKIYNKYTWIIYEKHIATPPANVIGITICSIALLTSLVGWDTLVR